MPDNDNSSPFLKIDDFFAETLQALQGAYNYDCELLAILKANILKADCSETSVQRAFDAICALAETRAKAEAVDA